MGLGLRPLRRDDFPLLAGWLAAPHVARWWREPWDDASMEHRYGPALDGNDPTEFLVVLWDRAPVGFLQRYLIDDEPGWKRSLEPVGVPEPASGIDYLIGEESLIGRGIGPIIIERAVTQIWDQHPEVVAIVADVAQDNRRSWRALEKCGFLRAWSGTLDTDEPNAEGPVHVYLLRRG